MKKKCISILVIAIIILSGIGFLLPSGNTEYLRIHIRANSNAEIDQSVKYAVKDAVVSFLTPIVAECDTKEKAEAAINDNLKNIEAVADRVLEEKGFTYKSSAKINNEKFPTRVYDDLTLESGYYDALIINLGEGAGNNWWCVVYPPLCFTGSGNYVYRSKVLEIIRRFKENKEKNEKIS